MATWKERGEVPDSEDEFADDNDIEIPLLRAGTPNKHARSPASPAARDIWEIPASSLERIAAPRSGKDTSPLLPSTTQDIWDMPMSSLEQTAAPETTDLPQPSTPPRQLSPSRLSSPLSEPPSDLSSDPGDPSTPERRRVRLTRADGRQFSPDPLADGFEPPTRALPKESAAVPTKAPGRARIEVLIRAPPASPPARPAEVSSYLSDTDLQEGDNGGNGPLVSSISSSPNVQPQNLTRDEPLLTPGGPTHDLTPRLRTFRPRKPIQEHPYALELARYANTFKSHGLKPLRLETAPEPALRKRIVEEDSQEKEFQDDSQETGDVDEDSQETVQDLLPDLSNESQRYTLDGEYPVQRLSLPSTPTTTFPRHRGGPSSQLGSVETQRTSLDGDADQDEFPPLEDLVKAPLPHTSSSKSAKRKSLSNISSRKKRLKTRQTSDHHHDATADDIYRLTPRLEPEAGQSPETPLLPRLVFPDDMSLSPPSPIRAPEESPSRDAAPSPPIAGKEPEAAQDAPVDLTAELDSSSTEESADSSSDSEVRDLAALKRAAKRLRGILPPSYLRLDETDGDKARRRPDHTRHAFGSPDRLPRKGVAQHRTSGKSGTPMRFDVFEDSDEDLTDKPPLRVDDSPPPMLQTTLVIETDEEDANSSAMEDNAVDMMLPTKKRQASRSAESQPAKRAKAHSRPALHNIQPKITSHFLEVDGKPSQTLPKSGSKPKSRKRRTGQPKTRDKKARSNQQRGRPAPRLSILDVIEPDAPRFLKVAARSARQSRDLGRSSPSKKLFQMATRWDHVEVNAVMQKWKGGQLKPRLPPDAKPRIPKSRERAQPATRPPALTFRQWPITKQKKLVKQVGSGGRVTYETSTETNNPEIPKPTQRRGPAPFDRPSFRPAQLETTTTEKAGYSFHSRKRALDNLWKRSSRCQQPETLATIDSGRHDDQISATASLPLPDSPRPARTESLLPTAHSLQQLRKSKFRKNFVPRAIDISAPQFSAAHEPLPAPAISPIRDFIDGTDVSPESNKLTGLAPYGTQYTHHFEIFPLDADVFFHESTLLGSGRIDKATDNWDEERLSRPRPRTSFTLDGKVLRWGPWDEQVSSELGILMDWLSDHLQGDQATSDPTHNNATLQAADFVLSYVQDSMSLLDSIAEQSFAYRFLEIMRSFLERFKDDKHPFEIHIDPGVVDTLCRILVMAFTCNHICRKSSHLVDVRMAMEDLLVRVSRITARALLSNGTDDVQKFLEESRHLSSRQRGIRPNQVVVHTWVVLMRVLEIASIPRSGFWDIVNSVLVPQTINSETNSETMEELWKTMFTLLPLREFDSQGVIVPGIRRLVSMEGWGLPQHLIKRVFELYKQNPRQAASFNNYCRALISRCHYLAREWGWSNCGSIIGTIFDFFGSQHLSHLRNEEAYKSPRFLEELASSPTLVVELEDRCFHIFLKFVALAIHRLRDRGSEKEIQNLITRVTPNHSRDYLKEQHLHAHDLASLRNHHDLLVTLFWAAPRNLRREVHRIEVLIRPADTHKDACLVNLRAWNQLARYIVSTEDDGDVQKAFHQWQCNIFRQLMDQYESAAFDAQQQYLALSKEDSQGISQTQIEFVVSMNKATAKEIIYACVNASRDVLPYACSISAATFALNSFQVGEVLRHFAVSPPTLDWTILKSALETLNAYISKVEVLCQKKEETNSPRSDDCMPGVMARLHRELSSGLFPAARCVIATEGIATKSATAEMEKSMCVELVTVLAARLFASFSKAGLVSASQALGSGKYGLFGREVHKLPPGLRKNLVLFVAILLKRGLPEVEALGPSLIELWLLALVKPRQFLAYENQLAEELKRRSEPFVPDAVVGLSIDPDYGSNRDLFECKSQTCCPESWFDCS